jgi:hypothetical protein
MCRRITTAFTGSNHCKQRSKHRHALLMTRIRLDWLLLSPSRQYRNTCPPVQIASTSDITQSTRRQNTPPKSHPQCLLRPPPLAPPAPLARATLSLVAVPTPRYVLPLRHKLLISTEVGYPSFFICRYPQASCVTQSPRDYR